MMARPLPWSDRHALRELHPLKNQSPLSHVSITED